MFPGCKYENNIKKRVRKNTTLLFISNASTLENGRIRTFVQKCEKILIQFASSSIE